MMKKTIQVWCIAFLWLLATGTSLAATVPYTFEVNIDSGSLSGNTYSGSFSYDDSDPTSLVDFDFTFDGDSFSETDDPLAAVFFSIFDPDEFVGIEYLASSINYEIYFAPGFGSVTEASFSYIGLASLDFDEGFGDITYSVVPVPAAVWLFGTALVGLVGFNKRRKSA